MSTRPEKSYAILVGLVIGFVVLLVGVCGFLGLFQSGQSFEVVHERRELISVETLNEQSKDAKQSTPD